MPKLDWIGKKAVVNHHLAVPFHLLKNNDDLSVGDPGSGNLLVQGDNLIALKALLPYYAGQVKCIYIDPPYNTGNENWVYNDNVNSPEMKAWLGRAVGKEAEDLSRHDKWLCMMYPRLSLLQKFLHDEGAIFISIDDNEQHYLRIIMDDIFGANNFLCAFAWEKRYSPPPDTKDIGYLHETILAYRCSSKFKRNLLPLTADQTGRYKNPDNDPRGPWKAMDYTCRYTATERPNLYYPIIHPKTGKDVWPQQTRVWAMSREVHEQNVAENRLWWGVKGNNTVPAMKNFVDDIQQGMMPVSLLKHEIVGHTDEAAKELRALIPELKFTPKPTRLIRHFLQIATDKDALILDSFAGSGTTGHAVLAQNAADDGNRHFILVEMDDNICRNITAQRLTKVSQGYNDFPALGVGFRYCELGEPLFDERGNIRATVSFADLARHVYFTETGEPLPATKETKSPLLGVHNGTAVYLLYNGILKDRTKKGGNVLTTNILAALPGHEGNKVIYGTACRIDAERLRREGIVFKQLPYKLKVGVL
jgi:site-specific DNA-methyltransferase (adenine-specific)/adenine-specific DNA-methyltransferase